jgi:GT2 family glycosyltransferase
MRQITFIIVSYNCLECIERLYGSLRPMMDSEGLDWEAIIVDNGSEDASAPFLEGLSKKDRRIRFIGLGQNLGFAAASNKGARAADSEYLVFLNPDTLFIDKGLGDMLCFYKKKEGIGALGPGMLDPDGSLQRNARSFPTVARQFYESFFLDRLFKSSRIFGAYFMTYSGLKEVMEVDWLSGAFLLISKKLFFEAGGFDAGYFMFSEDTDLCLRLRRMGLKNYYFASYRIVHEDAAVSGRDPSKRGSQIIRARKTYFMKNHSAFSAWTVSLLCLAGALNRAVLFFAAGLIRPKRGNFAKARQYLGILKEYFSR